MPLEKDLEHEDSVGLAKHVGRVPASERVRDEHKRGGHGLLTNVVEKADIAVQHDPDLRQRVEERIDFVGIAFKAPPVTDVILPPSGQEDR